MEFTAVTYNVHGFRAGVGRVARSVATLEPDILLLQETGSREALRRFAIATGMDAAADPPSPFRRRAKDAVMVRAPWSITSHGQQRFSGSAFFYPRAAIVARIARVGLPDVNAVSVHLGLSGAERGRHVQQLLALCDGLGGPVLIGGDFNARPDGSALRAVSARYLDAWEGLDDPGVTLPALDARIDYLFVTEEMTVERVWVPQPDDASDHLAVAARRRM